MTSSDNNFVSFQACDLLLAQRVEAKMKGRKVNDVLNRLHLAVPAKRDTKVGVENFVQWKGCYDNRMPVMINLEPFV